MSRRWLLRAALACAVLLAAAATAFLVWALTPLGPSPEALAALASDATVDVRATGAGWEFAPRSAVPSAGLIFYPGGRVDARSYAPLCRTVAEQGYLVALAKMPLSLAVLDPDAAREIRDSRPDVRRWVVGGHSLGGAMAATALAEDPGLADGLLLVAAYATAGADLSRSDLEVTDVTGTRDGVLDRENWSAGKALLPASARFVRIEGGNHAQFGSYGPQPGDTDATIPASEQLRLTAGAAVQLLERVAARTR